MLAGFLQVTGDKVLAPERVSVWLNSRARSGQQCACVKVTRHRSVRRCFQRNDVVLVEDGEMSFVVEPQTRSCTTRTAGQDNGPGPT